MKTSLTFRALFQAWTEIKSLCELEVAGYNTAYIVHNSCAMTANELKPNPSTLTEIKSIFTYLIRPCKGIVNVM